MEPKFYEGLRAGTILRSRLGGSGRIMLREDMRGAWAYVCVIRKDNQPDRRWYGWSGSLSSVQWEIAWEP